VKSIKRYQKVTAVLILFFSTGLIWLNYDRWFVHTVFSGKEKTGHLIVISVDALNSQDLNRISALPNFKKLLERGAYSREVIGVSPSLTYPAHTTIITGVYPDKHGLVNTEIVQAGSGELDWFWFSKYIRVTTLYDIAEESGMRTGAFLWPATGRANITYNMPEIKAHEGQSQLWAVLSNGSPLFLLDSQIRFGKLRNGVSQPELDSFVIASAKPVSYTHLTLPTTPYV
jgi:predicted AlkP superfamily pyrophosphatase or phosphodiesterase